MHLPAAEHVGRRAAVRQERLARTERQLVPEADRRAVPLVVSRIAFVRVQVPGVRRIVRFDLARAVVGALGELIVAEEEHAAGVPLFDSERDAIEPRPSCVGRVEDRGLERGVRHPGRNRRRARLCLVDVVALVLVVAAAAGVGDLEQVLIAERALDVAVPLNGVRRAVARIHRERRRELRDVVQIREERIGVEPQVGSRGLQRVLTVHRRHEPRELQLVQVQVVVVDAESGPHDGLVVGVVREPEARAPVVQVLAHDPFGKEVVLIDDERQQLRGQVRRHLVIPDLPAGGVE